MRDKLRQRYQVQKEISRNGSFEGEIALSEMQRLSEMLYVDDDGTSTGKIEVNFEFSNNELDAAMISGHLETELELQCQRCLQAIAMPIQLDFRLLIDASDELVEASGLDSVYSDDGNIDIAEVVEDELILGLPLVALHEDDSCHKHWQAAEVDSAEAVKENPFSVLKQLKTTNLS